MLLGDVAAFLKVTLIDRIGSSLRGAAAIYVGSTALNGAMTAGIIPVLVLTLSPSDYGLLALFQSLYASVTIIAFFGLRAPLVREMSVDSYGEPNRYVSSAMAMVVALTGLMLLVALLFQKTVEEAVHLPLPLILVVVVCGGAQSLYQVYLAILQAETSAWKYAVLQTTMSLVNIALTVFLLFVLHYGWLSRSIGYIVTALGGGGYAIVAIGWRRLYGAVRLKYMLEVLALGGSVVPAALFVGYLDRFVLGARFSPTDAGLYTLALQVSAVASLLGSALMLAVSPWAFRQMDLHQTREGWMRLAMKLALLAGLITTAIVIYGVFVFVLATSFGGWKYGAMMRYLPWLLTSAYFVSLYHVFILPLYHFKSAKLLTGSSILVTLSAVAFLMTLPDVSGAIGVAISLSLARFLQFAFVLGAGIYLVWTNLPGPAEPVPVDIRRRD